MAGQLLSVEAIIERLHAQAPITEGHLDELFPQGLHHGVRVMKDEHGRIPATQAVNQRDEDSVKLFLQRFKRLGVTFVTPQ